MKVFSLALALMLSISVFAQKGPHHHKPAFTKEQKIQLKLKRMSIALDLTPKQQNRIQPIVVEMIEKHEAQKEMKHNKKTKPTTDEMFAKAMNRLDQEANLHRRMKNILDKDQYWAWKLMHAKHKEKTKHQKHRKKDKEFRPELRERL